MELTGGIMTGGGTVATRGSSVPAVAALVGALALAAALLPSAFTLPQTDPTETAAYAPVPSDGDEPPADEGNQAALGLADDFGPGGAPGGPGSGPGGTGGGPGGPFAPGGPIFGGDGKSPSTKRCVLHDEFDAEGRPKQVLRQTEDPLSPPCVAHFEGDNGGATYPGVESEEIRILFYLQGAERTNVGCPNPNQPKPSREYFDLAEDIPEGTHCLVDVLKTWQDYFNFRYQTYGRFAHFFAYFSGPGNSAEERRADAAENHAKVQPFAVVSDVATFEEAYLEEMTRRGVLNFGSFASRSADFFRQFEGLAWGFLPTLEKQAETFASYVCTKVVRSDPERVYGLWSTDDPAHPELQRLADAAVTEIGRRCPVEFAHEATFPEAGYAASAQHSPAYAIDAAAGFLEAGVTTIIWPGGYETNLTNQMERIGLRPEFVVLGDGTLEGSGPAGFQAQSVWNGARVVTSMVMEAGSDSDQICYQAYRETDPDADETMVDGIACPLYPHIRQLFTGIQVAGPRVRPETVERGFRAIPAVVSHNPSVPACFYDAADYTCVKDAMAQRWSAEQSCYLAVQAGRRYFPGTWPEGDVDAQDAAGDPCNSFSGSADFNPRPPTDPENF